MKISPDHEVKVLLLNNWTDDLKKKIFSFCSEQFSCYPTENTWHQDSRLNMLKINNIATSIQHVQTISNHGGIIYSSMFKRNDDQLIQQITKLNQDRVETIYLTFIIMGETKLRWILTPRRVERLSSCRSHLFTTWTMNHEPNFFLKNTTVQYSALFDASPYGHAKLDNLTIMVEWLCFVF